MLGCLDAYSVIRPPTEADRHGARPPAVRKATFLGGESRSVFWRVICGMSDLFTMAHCGARTHANGERQLRAGERTLGAGPRRDDEGTHICMFLAMVA